MAQYFIYNTCPDLYDKTIKRLTKQLKKDKVKYSILEIDDASDHARGCNEINYKGVYPWGVRKVKACLTCEHRLANNKDIGRKNSTKTTIITWR